ncbi:predicted protein, partial [Nematostella vectensis]
KPSIISSYPGQTVNETIDFLKLTCISDGYPAPTSTWSRDGEEVSQTSVYYSDSVTRSEAGTYTCTATNEMGSDTTTVQVTVNCAKNESEQFVRSSESCVSVTAACSTVIAVLLVSNLMSLVYIYRTGRSKQESRIPRGALNSVAIDEDPITMNTIDLVTHTNSASSDVTYKNHGSPYDEVTATSTYQSLDRTTRTNPDGRGQARGPREYEAVGGSGPERGGEGQYAELTSTCPDYQPLHIYGNVGGAKGHRGMGTNA